MAAGLSVSSLLHPKIVMLKLSRIELSRYFHQAQLCSFMSVPR